jgi:asparagine synthase (glutamine-hydrolysing)
MADEAGTAWLVYNGEIYNFLELREELERCGHRFVSQCDAEVILSAYREWGTGMFSRLVGMFALAILDLSDRTLLIARDFCGMKPLYWTVDSDRLVWASEPYALRALAGGQPVLNCERAYAFLRYGATDYGEETMQEDVRQVRPGEWLRFSLEGANLVERRRYWSPSRISISRESFEDTARGLGALFSESVRLHMRSDVAVGCCLSGGLDSSAILASMSRLGSGAYGIHSFSAVFPGYHLDEADYSELVASACGAQRHSVSPTSDDMLADIEILTRAQGEPFTSLSVYAQYRVMRAAREAGVPVVLDGQGADEVLAGYPLMVAAGGYDAARRGQVVRAAVLLRSSKRLGHWSSPRLLANIAKLCLPQAVLRVLRERERLSAGTEFLDHEVAAEFASNGEADAGDERRGSLLRRTMSGMFSQGTLPQLLRYEDRNSMASSVESRLPFLTPELVNFCLGIPDHFLIDDAGTTKAVLRRAMVNRVPAPILQRRDKVAYASPDALWLQRGAPKFLEFLEGSVSGSQLIDYSKLRAAWRDVEQKHSAPSAALWRATSFALWAAEFGLA